MTAIAAVLLCFVFYGLGYAVYSRFLARRVFELRASAVTPARALADGVDYVPTHRFVLFGHHFASITGLSPMLGPAIAVIWGWVPAWPAPRASLPPKPGRTTTLRGVRCRGWVARWPRSSAAPDASSRRSVCPRRWPVR